MCLARSSAICTSCAIHQIRVTFRVVRFGFRDYRLRPGSVRRRGKMVTVVVYRERNVAILYRGDLGIIRFVCRTSMIMDLDDQTAWLYQLACRPRCLFCLMYLHRTSPHLKEARLLYRGVLFPPSDVPAKTSWANYRKSCRLVDRSGNGLDGDVVRQMELLSYTSSECRR